MKLGAVAAVFIPFLGVSAAAQGDIDPHGLSRAELYELFIVDKGLEPPALEAAGRFFQFPYDVDDEFVYGIDISHHKGVIEWSRVRDQGVSFAYSKATEGRSFVDRWFHANIAGARTHGMVVGAYHFLSSGVPVDEQVRNFVDQYSRIRDESDLPPVLDLEWDYSRQTGTDRWAGLPPDEIVRRAEAWLIAVEAELDVRPMIYTNKHWWETRIGNSGDRLQGYNIWMSRYGGWSDPGPPIMNGFEWSVWQFTEEGSVPGITGDVDVNKLALSFNPVLENTIEESAAPCVIPAAPAAQPMLTSEELLQVFSMIRVEFGSLNNTEVEFLDLLINSASPDQLRRMIEGGVERPLSEADKQEVFNVARGALTNGTLTQSQVDLLNILFDAASADLVRTCLLQ